METNDIFSLFQSEELIKNEAERLAAKLGLKNFRTSSTDQKGNKPKSLSYNDFYKEYPYNTNYPCMMKIIYAIYICNSILFPDKEFDFSHTQSHAFNDPTIIVLPYYNVEALLNGTKFIPYSSYKEDSDLNKYEPLKTKYESKNTYYKRVSTKSLSDKNSTSKLLDAANTPFHTLINYSNNLPPYINIYYLNLFLPDISVQLSIEANKLFRKFEYFLDEKSVFSERRSKPVKYIEMLFKIYFSAFNNSNKENDIAKNILALYKLEYSLGTGALFRFIDSIDNELSRFPITEKNAAEQQMKNYIKTFSIAQKDPCVFYKDRGDISYLSLQTWPEMHIFTIWQYKCITAVLYDLCKHDLCEDNLCNQTLLKLCNDLHGEINKLYMLGSRGWNYLKQTFEFFTNPKHETACVEHIKKIYKNWLPLQQEAWADYLLTRYSQEWYEEVRELFKQDSSSLESSLKDFDKEYQEE